MLLSLAPRSPAPTRRILLASRRQRRCLTHLTSSLRAARPFVPPLLTDLLLRARGRARKRQPGGPAHTPSQTNATGGTEEEEEEKGSGSGGSGGGGGSSGGSWWTPQTVFLLSSTSLLLWWVQWNRSHVRPEKEISWQVFRDTLLFSESLDHVKVVVGSNRALVKVYLKGTSTFSYWFTVPSAVAFETMVAEAETAKGVPTSQSLRIAYDDRLEIADLGPLLGWLLWVGIVMYMFRPIGEEAAAGIMQNVNKRKFKPVVGTRIRFKDVAGMTEAKQEIMEFVDILKHPERYAKLGAKVPSGAILLGPPGTGKTLLAKAVAGESGVPFFSVCGADFVEMYVGVGASRVRELFRSAKQHERAIIYIDEIDAVGRKRGGSLITGGNSERENTLNQLLIEMDGFQKESGKIIVLASTNVATSSLDEALIRPGRLDRQVFIDRPTVYEREEIFHRHLDTINLIPTVDYENKKAESEEAREEAERFKRKTLGLPEPVKKDEEKEETDQAKTSTAKDKDEEKKDGETKKDSGNSGYLRSWNIFGIRFTFRFSVNNKAKAAKQKEKVEKGEKEKEEMAAPTSPGITKVQAKAHGAKRFAQAHRLRQKIRKESSERFEKNVIPNSFEVKDKIAKRMAQLSPGFVGADIANICNEGALLAAREQLPFVDLKCMEKAIDRVIGGIEKRSRVMSDFEKKAVAYHEAGHAVVGWFLANCDPLMKISMVPRGVAALGYAQYLPKEVQMQTLPQLFDNMCMTLGGRASELVHFGHLSTGAQDDLSKVTRLAYTAVSTFGMARSKLGSVVSYPAPGTSETSVMKPYSDEVAELIDIEVKSLVDRAFAKTLEIINERRKEIEAVAEHLLKNEVITREEFVKLVGPRPFVDEYLPQWEGDKKDDKESSAASPAAA